MLTLKDYVNWGLTHCDKVESAEGVPLVLEKCVKNKRMKQLEVYGESVQNGTPTPDAPVEVESVGELVTDVNDTNYGKYKIPVTVRGKNLYDAKSYPMTVGYYVNATTGIIPISADYAATSSYIPCVNLQRKQITINYTGGANPGIAYYDENKAYISGTKNNSSTKITSIVPDNAYYYRFCIRAEYVDVVQVELGEVPTDFEPYTEPQTTNIYLNEPLRRIGDYADVIDFKNKKVMRNVREVVFSGGELVYTWSIINGKVYGTDKLYTDANTSYFAYGNATHSRSTHFVAETNKFSEALNINEWSVFSSYRICFVFSDDVSRDDANSWMQSQYDAGTPVKCYYALSASVSEPITCDLPILTAKTSIVEIDTSILPSNIKGKYIKK